MSDDQCQRELMLESNGQSFRIDVLNGCFWPRLCQNALFIIMCRSKWQGKPNEAFH